MVQNKDKKLKILLFGLFFFLMFAAVGCGNSGKRTSVQNKNRDQATEDGIEQTEGYDEIKNMVFVKLDKEAKSVILQDVENGVRYTLNYTGGTYVYNKSGSPITMEQIGEGELVEASFDYADSKLGKLQLLKDAWVYEEVENTELNRANFRMRIYGSNYKFSDRLFILSNGKELGLNELNEEDVLTIRGIGKSVYSITVERGHGYIVLTGYENFVDGWVEVGSKVIRRVVQDMILVAPEGDYVLTVEKNGFGGYKNITVLRDEETKVDVSDLKEAAVRSGNIRFSITPSEAKLYIAGVETDYSNLVALDYGIYKIKVTADGYETYEGKLTVDDLVKEQKIELKKTGGESDTDNTSSDNTSSDNASSDNTSAENTNSSDGPGETEDYKVIINGPEGAEVYLDGAYVGRAPVSFKKTAGSHTLIFRRDGYTTKTYTIEVDSEKKDLTMAFPDLEKKTTTTSSTNSNTSLKDVANELLDSILLDSILK